MSLHRLLRPHPLEGYHLHLIPPTTKGSLWFGYATHEASEIDCADATHVGGATISECARNLELAVREYRKTT